MAAARAAPGWSGRSAPATCSLLGSGWPRRRSGLAVPDRPADGYVLGPAPADPAHLRRLRADPGPAHADRAGRGGPGRDRAGLGLFSAARQVGGAVGLAVLGTVAWTGAPALPGVPAGALATGAGRGFLGAALITALAVAITAVTLHVGARTPHPEPARSDRRVGRPPSSRAGRAGPRAAAGGIQVLALS